MTPNQQTDREALEDLFDRFMAEPTIDKEMCVIGLKTRRHLIDHLLSLGFTRAGSDPVTITKWVLNQIEHYLPKGTMLNPEHGIKILNGRGWDGIDRPVDRAGSGVSGRVISEETVADLALIVADKVLTCDAPDRKLYQDLLSTLSNAPKNTVPSHGVDLTGVEKHLSEVRDRLQGLLSVDFGADTFWAKKDLAWAIANLDPARTAFLPATPKEAPSVQPKRYL